MKIDGLKQLLTRINQSGTELVRIDRQVHAALKEHCKERKIKMSDYTETAILEKIIKELEE